VSGATVGSFDLPAVRAFIRIFAPRRGEIVVDAEALDLRPVRVRGEGSRRLKAPRRRSRRAAGPAATAPSEAASPEPAESGPPAPPEAEPTAPPEP
jgi:hypothetical protein